MRTGVPDPEWRHWGQIDRLGIVFARLFREIGDCRLPLSVGPAVAAQLFEMWNVLTDCRISRNRWSLGANDVERQEFCDAVSRNVAKVRTRLGLEQARLQAGLGAEIRDQNGDVIKDQLGDEVLPAISDAVLLGNTSFLALGPARNTFGNPSTPKREAQGAPLGALEPKLPKTEEAAESERDDLSFTHRHTAWLPEALVAASVSNGQLLKAGSEPTRGWPACSTLFPMDGPTQVARDLIFAAGNYKDLDPRRGWVTGDHMEPLPRARKVAGAERAGASDFRAVGALSSPIRPLVARDYQVWALRGRQARDGKQCH